jgi:hypothetical protein
MGLLLTSVARRLNGQGGDPVIQLPHLGGRQKNAGTTVRDGALGNTFECLYLPPKLSVRVQHQCSTLRGVAQSGTHSTSPPSHTSGVGTGDQLPRHTARGAASGSWADNNPSLLTILRSWLPSSGPAKAQGKVPVADHRARTPLLPLASMGLIHSSSEVTLVPATTLFSLLHHLIPLFKGV